MDRVSATEFVGSGLILGRVKQKTIKIGNSVKPPPCVVNWRVGGSRNMHAFYNYSYSESAI